MAVESPYEILELGDGSSMSTHVVGWELGTMDLVPRDGRAPKTVKTLRLHVPAADKTHYPPYWDLTAQTLIAQLLPRLDSIVKDKKTLTIKKSGSGPGARFSTEVK